MIEYIFFMHNDASVDDAANNDEAWARYLAMLRATGRFSGGSSLGGGACFNKAGTAAGITSHLSGYVRVEAEDIGHATLLLKGNPVYEAGGTVEIRVQTRG